MLHRITEGSSTVRPPRWLREGSAVVEHAEPAEPPAGAALFGRVHRRGLLSSAIGRLDEEGPLDIEAIVEVLASDRPLRRLPRALVSTTRFGLQVLVDRGPAMDPFRGDQEQLLEALDDILADDRLEVREFLACPGLEPPAYLEEESEPWSPPPPGTPILALTDLGIGGSPLDEPRASLSDWLAFARRVRTGGHRLVALVPYEATRWPSRLASAMTLVHWSERTTVGAVRHATRDARRPAPP